MKEPPSSLPAANSAKWHSRQNWDSLGYFRVRTLANPKWERDVQRVIRRLEHEAPVAAGSKRSCIEEAIKAAHVYARLKPRSSESTEEFAARLDAEWDTMLAAIDAFLELRQQEHLRAVDQAGRSGRA